jgi:hypothetical protein
VQALEKVCQELIERAKNKDLRAKGPVRLPTKILKITVRFFILSLQAARHPGSLADYTEKEMVLIESFSKTDPQDPLR